MCDCINTFYDITTSANKIRNKKGLTSLPYLYVYKEWQNLFKNYEGIRNPYKPDRKVGVSFTFSKYKANKIAKKVSEITYKGNPKSSTYIWWARVA